MAHYAYLDDNNIVVTVTVGKDETELIDGMDAETYYAQGTPYQVKRTSYNNKIRKQFAGIGFRYDPNADIFIAPQPYSSWSLDPNFDWQPPVPYPQDGQRYVWDEDGLTWKNVDSIS